MNISDSSPESLPQILETIQSGDPAIWITPLVPSLEHLTSKCL